MSKPGARVRTAVTVAVAAVAAVCSVWLFAAAGADGGDFELRLSVSPSVDGEVTVRAAPLGSLSADSFLAPGRLLVEVGDLKPEVARATVNEALSGTTPAVLERDATEIFTDGISRGLARLLLASLLCGVVGGAAAAALLRRRRSDAVLGAAVGLATVVVLASTAWLTHDPRAYQSPTVTGAFAAQPVTGDPRPGTLQLPDVQSYLGKLQRNVKGLYQGFLLPAESATARQGATPVVVAVRGTPVDLVAAVVSTSEAAAVVWLDDGDAPSDAPQSVSGVPVIRSDQLPATVGAATFAVDPSGVVTVTHPGEAGLAITVAEREPAVADGATVITLESAAASQDAAVGAHAVLTVYLDPASGTVRAYDMVSASATDVEVQRHNLQGRG